MELISRDYFCQVCSVSSIKDIRWKRFLIPKDDINLTIEGEICNDQVLLGSVELPLLDEDLAVIFIPSLCIVMVPEIFSNITLDILISKLKLPIGISNWTLEYQGEDNFPSYRLSEFIQHRERFIDKILEVKNLKFGRYLLTSPCYSKLFEVFEKKSDWYNEVLITNDTISSVINTKLSDRLFDIAIIQLCLFKYYKE